MAYPSKHSTTITYESKNTSTSTNDGQSGQFFLLIDDTYILLIDTEDKLLIQSLSTSWSYATKH